MYTNDEADKAVRRRHYYLTVYLLPVALVAAFCGLVYWAATMNYVEKINAMYGYFTPLIPAMLLSAFNRKNWLKMPDGTFHNIRHIAATQQATSTEPAVYEAEYFLSKKEKAISTLTGVALLAVTSWLFVKKPNQFFIPLTIAGIGVFLTYSGIQGLLDKRAKLKIAKNGLWTNRLGFVTWNNIKYAKVEETKSGRTTQLYLNIQVKGTKFEEANQPDERLLLSDLDDKEMIELVINKALANYHPGTDVTGNK